MKKVLIIDDDEKVARALDLRVKSAGYQSVVAYDAVSGVVTAANVKPDAVLLDISMPGGNGFTVAQRIHTILPYQIPIIFITASRKPGLFERAHNLGASGFIEKPYNPETLLQLLHGLLGCPPDLPMPRTDSQRWSGINE
jgi:CheY-like chemotaxis protein